jgi:hypothetical protein
LVGDIDGCIFVRKAVVEFCRLSAGAWRGEAMDRAAIQDQLCSFVNTRKKVRLTRSVPNESWHNGFVVAVGRDWVLLQQFHDFYPEGCTALRVEDITCIRSDEHERLWESMLVAEGIFDRLAAPYDVPLDDVANLLNALKQRGKNIIVQCEDAEEKVEDFYIGQILSVDHASVSFANFDALGRWDEAPHRIPYGEITQVQFDTPYVQTFSKYLEGPYRPNK